MFTGSKIHMSKIQVIMNKYKLKKTNKKHLLGVLNSGFIQLCIYLFSFLEKCKKNYAQLFAHFSQFLFDEFKRQVEGILTSESWIESKKQRDALTYHISPHFSLKRSVQDQQDRPSVHTSNVFPSCPHVYAKISAFGVFRKRVITKSWGCPQAVWLSFPDDPRGIKSGLLYPGWPTSLNQRGENMVKCVKRKLDSSQWNMIR